VAGIYIHIPFCKQKCNYCDFYKTTLLRFRKDFLDAIFSEIAHRKDFLSEEPVETIYFGGGTPSVLLPGELDTILCTLRKEFSVEKNAEITLEANPDDLTTDYLAAVRSMGINRLSIGIQSFSDRDLRLLNRRHTAKAAIMAIQAASSAGFSNISADLIYGIPGQSNNEWKENLVTAVGLPIHHISAYNLTFHIGTPLYQWLQKGKISEQDEEEIITRFDTLYEITSGAGFEQYEISNFARNNAYSRHNTSYWLAKKYLGLGPAAHSFNGDSRQWNIADLEKYISGIQSGSHFRSIEILSEKDKLNEYILTGIRTKWGISLAEIRKQFGEKTAEKVLDSAQPYRKEGKLVLRDGILLLTRGGILISDQITVDLMAE
jgi:oxygen-independent coproporphyrinogen III oxidase